MIRHIPPKEIRRWTGPYLGDYYGTLWKTYNIDLDKKEGQISLAQRMQRIEDTTEVTGINISPIAFLRTDADCTPRYWALSANDGLLKTDSASPEDSSLPSLDWDTDVLDSTPADPRDFTVHGNDSRNDSGRNKLFVTRDTGDIAVLNDTGGNVWDGTWWTGTQSQPRLDTDAPFRPIEYFPFRKISLVGDGNLVHTISRFSDTVNDTVSYARVVLPKDLAVRHIFPTSTRSWFLCYNVQGGAGAVVSWDGFSQSYNDIYNANNLLPVLGVNYKDVPIILNNKGEFMEFTGNGFIPMIRNGQKVAFPMAEELGSSLAAGAGANISFRVDPRSMIVGEDGFIYINMGNPTKRSFRQGSGIWALNPITGRLYNKYSFGQWGDSVDYGQQVNSGTVNSGSGGIYWVPTSVTERNILAGHTILEDASTATTGIWLVEDPDSTTATRGYFITQYIPAEEIREFFDTVYVKFKRFISSTNSIIVKARGTRPLVLANGGVLQATITWTTTTTFTVTLAASDDALQEGDEVEVVAGANSGFLSHIVSISGAHAALQTITVDETMTTAGSTTALARFDRWKKLGTITDNTRIEQFLNVGIDSSFIQFKVELRGTPREMELQELVVTSKDSLKIQ